MEDLKYSDRCQFLYKSRYYVDVKDSYPIFTSCSKLEIPGILMINDHTMKTNAFLQSIDTSKPGTS